MYLSFNRVILFVLDVETLKCFYQENFGFKILEEIKNEWVVLNAGNCQLALHRSGSSAHQSASAASNVKLVFEVAAGLQELVEVLLEKNLSMREIKSFPGIPYLFCDGSDPEGNVFQLMQKAG